MVLIRLRSTASISTMTQSMPALHCSVRRRCLAADVLQCSAELAGMSAARATRALFTFSRSARPRLPELIPNRTASHRRCVACRHIALHSTALRVRPCESRGLLLATVAHLHLYGLPVFSWPCHAQTRVPSSTGRQTRDRRSRS